MQLSDAFSESYAEARERFLLAADTFGASVQTQVLPGWLGAEGEPLAMDAAWLGSEEARRLLLITSGTQGVEGLSGSGIQVAMLHDAAIVETLRELDVAALLVHAVNPYGFSHLHRVNEENVDVNRNAVPPGRPLPHNEAYEALHALLVPEVWPPSEASERALMAIAEASGLEEAIDAVGGGQYRHPDGLFYGGVEPSWSLRTLASLIDTRFVDGMQVVWIDLHSGPGAFGHGSKVLMNGADDPGAHARALRCWGIDVALPGDAHTNWARAEGRVSTLARRRPGVELTAIGLDFGVVPAYTAMLAVRADAWRRAYPQAAASRSAFIGRQLREAFYSDDPHWRSRVLGQSRVAILQAIRGLAESDRASRTPSRRPA